MANEFAKMRHLGIGLLVGMLLVGVSGLVVFFTLGSGARSQLDDPWKAVLADLAMAASLVTPLLLAVIASRLVEIEHSGNGWTASSTSGVTPGRLCRAKFAALGLLVASTTVAWGALLIGFGEVAGIAAPAPTGRWIGYIATLVVINLVVLAFQILLSAHVENQLVALGVGVVGTFFAIFGSILPAWISHLVPWGYYALTTPADYVGMDLVYFDLPYLSVIALAVVGGGLFVAVTARFDRSEA